MMSLSWLPKHADASGALKELKKMTGSPSERLKALRALVKHDIDFVQTGNADKRLSEIRHELGQESGGLSRFKLAILSSVTIDHLLPALRVAALRRGLLLECHVGAYNQYRQELLDSSSSLYAFAPDAVLLSLDAQEAGFTLPLDASDQDVQTVVQQRVEDWTRFWAVITEELKAVPIHQTVNLPGLSVFGHYDALVPASPANLLAELNSALKRQARLHKVALFDWERAVSQVGKSALEDPALWHHAKQAVSPAYAPFWGDHVARIVAGLRGRSAKALVLDLDNTLWGGVIGDDGLAGIEIGQGTGRGEAFLAFQQYVQMLKNRGIVLAVCSKNEEANALAPFQEHPDMLLRREDFAVIVANWDHKAGNIERIAKTLNLGLDALVFFDDNPAERKLVREFLPDVWVPEVPEDPAYYAACLSDGGYFETAAFTADDLKRSGQYQANAQRAALQGQAHDLDSFLRGLKMQMDVAPFDEVGLSRIAQLINKSNQFNLTTRRYTEAQVREWAADASAVTFQVRLKDACGDNGMISVLIGKADPSHAASLRIDTWLMSCRVLGRQVEQEVLNLLVEQARSRGFEELRGDYVPTEKNPLVREHYRTLGFEPLTTPGPEGASSWRLRLSTYQPVKTAIQSSYRGGVPA